MRRKNWINKKKFLFDNLNHNKIKKTAYYSLFLNKIIKALDEYKVYIFIKTLYYLRNKHTNNLIKTNIFYLSFLLKFFKKFKRKLMFRTFYSLLNKNKLLLVPSFFFLSQFFEYKNLFFNVLNEKKIEGFFIYKNFFKITGYYNEYLLNYNIYINYNFFIFKNSFDTFFYLNEIFKHKESNKIGKVKYFFQPFKTDYYFNYYFNYNLFVLNTVEFYKIIIYLNINSINKFI